MPLTSLLPPARLVQDHALDCGWIIELRYMWIVERNVPVLSDSDKGQIDGSLIKKVRVPLQFSIQIGRVTLQVIHAPGVNSVFESVLDPVPEAGGMGGGNVYVFVHVERLDYVPVHPLLQDECVNKVDLGVPGSHHNPGLPMFSDRARDQKGRLLRRFGSQGLRRRADRNPSLSIIQLFQRHWVSHMAIIHALPDLRKRNLASCW
ncbi:MAG: hypothetical protein JWO80_5142, partial [Bryobacterales bacterium]|nr:hypothetical protein [Bryobacterales bacterium]